MFGISWLFYTVLQIYMLNIYYLLKIIVELIRMLELIGHDSCLIDHSWVSILNGLVMDAKGCISKRSPTCMKSMQVFGIGSLEWMISLTSTTCSRKIPCTKCISYFWLVVKIVYFSDVSILDPLLSFLIGVAFNMQSQVKNSVLKMISHTEDASIEKLTFKIPYYPSSKNLKQQKG